MSIRATYRIQFHRDFTFADAEAIVPYLAALGISHLYASPITVAQPGSTHGYDVVDPTRINPELGGERAFRSLVAALRAHRMGAIIDIVPNHMGVAGKDNPWWQDVLENGPASDYARFFDIDWREKLLLPFLGEPLRDAIDNRALELRHTGDRIAVVAYDTHHFSIRKDDRAEVLATGVGSYGPAELMELLERQHWRLAWWRTGNDALNWRRFFTITELAGLRAEDPAVFEASHALYFRLYSEGLIDGVRIDHVDGLSDPAGYCRSLRERLRGLESERPADLREPAYIVVEKILAQHEPLARDWGIDGTSGYDFMAEISALLHDPGGEEALSRFWTETSGRPAEFEAEELQARREMLDWEFEGQLQSCVSAFSVLAASARETESLTSGMLRRAIERLLWVFPVYRTYGTGSDAPEADQQIREIARARALPLAAPGEDAIIEHILAWLGGKGAGNAELVAEAVRRFQQLSAPIAAKAVEDTAFYRYGRLLSRNDVGFDPGLFAMPADDFHERTARRRADFRRSMLATATHDHKRGEDVRARLALISECPDEWIGSVTRWSEMLQPAPEIDPADLYPLYQTLFGAWPADLRIDDGEALAAFARRVAAWQEKALREAKLRSSWAAPDEDYEKRARECVERLLDPARSAEFLADFSAFVTRLRPAAEAKSLVQSFLRCTVPGVPDLYQGAEYEDLSLVDPDNRRPVDFSARIESLSAGALSSFDAVKQRMIAGILRARAALPELWNEGSYEPLKVKGGQADRLIAFLRQHGGHRMIAIASLRHAEAAEGPNQWGDTHIYLPRGLDVPGCTSVVGEFPSGNGPVSAAALFERSPVHLLLDTRS